MWTAGRRWAPDARGSSAEAFAWNWWSVGRCSTDCWCRPLWAALECPVRLWTGLWCSSRRRWGLRRWLWSPRRRGLPVLRVSRPRSSWSVRWGRSSSSAIADCAGSGSPVTSVITLTFFLFHFIFNTFFSFSIFNLTNFFLIRNYFDFKLNSI